MVNVYKLMISFWVLYIHVGVPLGHLYIILDYNNIFGDDHYCVTVCSRYIFAEYEIVNVMSE